MLLLLFLIIGLLIGFLRGGGLSGLVKMKIKAPLLMLLPFLIDVSFYFLNARIVGSIPYGMLPVQALRFLPLILFVVLNSKDWRILLLGIGVLMNFAVIMANGGRMPVNFSALAMPELAASVQRVAEGAVPEYIMMTTPAGAPLWFLGDMIIITFPTIGFASIGDLLLGLGMTLAVQHGMARFSLGKHMKGTLADNAGEARTDALRLEETHAPLPQLELITPKLDDISQQQVIVGPDGAHKGISVQLSPRLNEIAAMVGAKASVADVGCDHGKLSVYLALRGSPTVIATDVSKKSLAKAKKLVKELNLQHIVNTRVGNGLERIRPGEVDTIVIAGMGGLNICAILSEGGVVVEEAAKLVLQPMNAVGSVRSWLMDNGFYLANEAIIEDDGRLYHVLCALPGIEHHRPVSLFELEIGHLLVENRHPLLGRLLSERVETIDKIFAEIEGISTPKAESRRIELSTLRARCVEVEQWLAPSRI